MAPKAPSAFAALGKLIALVTQLAALLFACHSAFSIRTFAIDNYGRLIHECVASRIRGRVRLGARALRLAAP